MTADRRTSFEGQEHNPSAAAPSPAGEAIARRVLGRMGRGRGVIPPEAAEGLPGRIARLASGRLPLLDALQRRWGSSAVSWPNASDLPFATGLARAREAEIGQGNDDARPYPASPGGALPVVEVRPASHEKTIPDRLRGGFEGAAGQSDIAGTVSRFVAESGLSEAREPLPVVKVSRPRAQGAPALPAESVSADLAPFRPEMTSSRPDAMPEPSVLPLAVVHAQAAPAGVSPVTAALSRRAAGTSREPTGGLPRQSETSKRAADVSFTPIGPAGSTDSAPTIPAASRVAKVGAPRVARLAPATAVAPTETAPVTFVRRSSSQLTEQFARSAGAQQMPTERDEAQSVAKTEQTSITGRMLAPGMTRLWGEPIAQRARGHRGAGGRDSTPARRAPAVPDAPLPLNGPVVSLTSIANASQPGIISRSAAGSNSPEGSAPLPIARSSAAPGFAEAQDAAMISVRSAAVGSIRRQTSQKGGGAPATSEGTERPAEAPEGHRSAALPVASVPTIGPESVARPARARELIWDRGQPVVPEQREGSRVVSAPAFETGASVLSGIARQYLPIPVQQQGSSSIMASPAQQRGSSPALPFLLQRQADSSTGSAAAPDGAGGGQSAASPGGSQAAASPEPASTSRVRLDELEMARVANTVMELLRRQLQIEREARGL